MGCCDMVSTRWCCCVSRTRTYDTDVYKLVCLPTVAQPDTESVCILHCDELYKYLHKKRNFRNLPCVKQLSRTDQEVHECTLPISGRQNLTPPVLVMALWKAFIQKLSLEGMLLMQTSLYGNVVSSQRQTTGRRHYTPRLDSNSIVQSDLTCAPIKI